MRWTLTLVAVSLVPVASKVTARYHDVRFGGGDFSAAELDLLESEVRQLDNATI